ncbi:MAG: D-sedoheptulose 7-phosphate isomerase [bacterium]
MNTDINIINNRFNETLEVLTKIKETQTELINEVAKTLTESFKSGNKLLICGNGGSAADAQHIAAEFIGKFYKIDRPALPAIALNTNTSIITALANDFGYEMTFSRQVEGLGQNGDVFITISTSGNSINAIEAAKIAKEKGMKVISFTGEGGGKLAEVSDITIKVPSKNTPIIQNAHISILHIICEIVENKF